MSMNSMANIEVSPKQLKSALRACIQANRPAMIWGAPGLGKSSIVQALADEDFEGRMWDYRLGQKSIVDLTGVPFVDQEFTDSPSLTHFAPPAEFPQNGSDGIFFWDEITTALPALQAAAYQAIHDRRVGEYRFPEGVRMIAAGNRESDRGVVFRMPTPLASRFIHFTLRSDINEWSEWAVASGVPIELVMFLRFRPELLHRFDPKSAEQAFPCPRTWEFVGDLLKTNADKQTEYHLIRGTVGNDAAAQVLAFLKIFRELPNVDAVIMDPDGAAIPDKADVLLALCGALASQVDDGNFDRIARYAARLDREYGAFLMKDCVTLKPELQHTAPFVKWVTSTN